MKVVVNLFITASFLLFLELWAETRNAPLWSTEFVAHVGAGGFVLFLIYTYTVVNHERDKHKEVRND